MAFFKRNQAQMTMKNFLFERLQTDGIKMSSVSGLGRAYLNAFNGVCLFIMSLATMPSGYAKDNQPLLLNVDFAHYLGNPQIYTQTMLREDFGLLDSRASGEIRGFDHADKVWPARNQLQEGYLVADFPANIASGKESGFLFDKRLPDMTIATMEYRLKFDPDFYWASGGKLPGLGGAAKGAGIPVGCTKNKNNIENGFSARLMWRKHGDLVLYTYFPDRNIKKCGVNHKFFRVKADKWYTITQTIQMNTPGKKDGRIWMFVDDKLVYQMDDVYIRANGKDKVVINAAIFHTYRGGKKTDPRFHSPKREKVYFDDFKVWQGKRPDLSYD